MKTFYNYDAYAKWREQGDPTEFVKCVGEGALFWADAYNWRNRHKTEPEKQSEYLEGYDQCSCGSEKQCDVHPQPAGEAVPVDAPNYWTDRQTKIAEQARPPQPSEMIAAVERAFDEIRELNMSSRDENGHRWANSDLIDQTVTEGLVALRALKGGA